jgi:hypothetical protein
LSFFADIITPVSPEIQTAVPFDAIKRGKNENITITINSPWVPHDQIVGIFTKFNFLK